jgi:hypothetical protein
LSHAARAIVASTASCAIDLFERRRCRWSIYPP